MQEKCHISCSKFVKYQETALVTSFSWYLWKERSRCWYMQSDTKLAINVCLKINCGSIQRSTLKNNYNSCNNFIHIIFAETTILTLFVALGVQHCPLLNTQNHCEKIHFLGLSERSHKNRKSHKICLEAILGVLGLK